MRRLRFRKWSRTYPLFPGAVGLIWSRPLQRQSSGHCLPMQISCDVFSGERDWCFGIPTGSLAEEEKRGNRKPHVYQSIIIMICVCIKTRLIPPLGLLMPERSLRFNVAASSLEDWAGLVLFLLLRYLDRTATKPAPTVNDIKTTCVHQSRQT